MTYKALTALGLIFFMACKTPQPVAQNTYSSNTVPSLYPTISYLDIKLDTFRRLPTNPYILEFKSGKKHLVFCGVNHLTDNSDTLNPLFLGIEKKFFQAKPQVSVNEGGDVSKKYYKSKGDALMKGGEIGLLKVLSDSLKIATVNGDADIRLEFSEMLKTYTKGELLAYIVTERLMWGLKDGNITKPEILERRFNNFIENYIINRGGMALNETERTFNFFKTNYEKLLNRPFDLEELEATDPFDPNGKFQAIGRASKEIRDQFLLKTIDQLLDTHDRVFVVFGGWHLLTCEPGLREIMNRKK
jgi:hypothetical protein